MSSLPQSPFIRPMTPPRDYRPYISPSPTPSVSSTISSSSRSRSSFNNRYSPYPRVKTEQSDTEEEEEEEKEVLRDINDVDLDELRVNQRNLQKQKARSTSPYEGLQSAKPKFAVSDYRSKRPLTHRRAHSMSTISYGYFIFPSDSSLSSSSSTPTSSRTVTPQSTSPCLSHRPINHARTQSVSAASQLHPRYYIRPQIPSPPSNRTSPVIPQQTRYRAMPTPIQSQRQTPAASVTEPMPSSGSGNSRRLILVNPAVAHHLKHGGMVNIRSVDGQKSFKVCLPPKMGRIGGVDMIRSVATSTF
ncbi:uncharacterized protein L201_000194 [Kwoniella dendrophila CBS 6074]|uniref:Uncharacterized protein n=1 Tax=Kwoniella dendrophila CBS 6074 TaxID=1295534 RepID=A0AAX4JIN9_9TREE